MESEPKMEKLITVEDATLEDVPSIFEVQREAWLATYPNEELGITEEDIRGLLVDSLDRKERWRQNMESNPNRHAWVAKEDQKIVGFSVGEKGSSENRLRAIYILPDHQGKGMGRQLAEECLEWLGDEKDVLVDVASYNESAIEFYKKLGFTGEEPIDEKELVALPSGKKIPEIRMRKAVKKPE